MTLENLQAARTAAMKAGDMATKNVLSNMIDACQKATITSKGRVEITEQLVDEVLIKYQKTIQEMIDTCPANRTDLMDKYVAEMAVVKEFAPQLITDSQTIKDRMFTLVMNAGLTPDKKNKGAIMKLASAEFKGKADMKIVSQVVAEMLV